jgi:hypothetical protein
MTRPRGRLPQRVYWFRRSLVLATALALVFGIAHLLGAGGSSTDGRATITAARTRTSPPPASSLGSGSSVGSPQLSGGTPTTTPSTALPTPTGPCTAADVTVTPVVGTAAAGRSIPIQLRLTGTQPACTFTVSPQTVVLKVTSGVDRVWSSQDCPRAIPTQSVAVRSAAPTTVRVSWDGRRSDSSCSRATAWAEPGYYHALAAALGSRPSDVQFRLTLPSRPVVTRTARPKPGRSATPSPSGGSSGSTSTPTAGATTGVPGKQSACGGDNAC